VCAYERRGVHGQAYVSDCSLGGDDDQMRSRVSAEEELLANGCDLTRTGVATPSMYCSGSQDVTYQAHFYPNFAAAPLGFALCAQRS
jgi:hypothetical protein